MKLEIVTPDQKLFEGEAESVTLPGVMGQFQILDRHAPLISVLEKGEVSIGGGKPAAGTAEAGQTFVIEGGVVEVLNNQVVVLAEGIVAKK